MPTEPVPSLVRDTVDMLIQRQLVPEEYRGELERSVDAELRRKARLLGTTLARCAMDRVLVRQMLREVMA